MTAPPSSINPATTGDHRPMTLSERIAQARYADPQSAYRALVADQSLHADPHQQYVVERLQALHRAVSGYRPAPPASGGWRERLGLTRRPKETAPQGLYLFGGVGRGKSMLMDLFFHTATVERRRRVHFHAFMLEVHARLHALRQQDKTTTERKAARDIIAAVADEVAEQSWLLCFDEFHVTDIADAMILGRLFEALFERGVVVLATSNWAPDDLYQGGLQRELFLPFIAIIKQRLDVIELDHDTDYRLERLRGRATYHYPDGPASQRALDQAFEDLTRGGTPTAASLAVQGRTLHVPRQAAGVARMSFAELCEQPLGSADYLCLAAHYHTLILEHVPRLSEQRRNEAKRLILLIDALYEAHRRRLISAAVSAEQLHPAGQHSFEFQRTHSRLVEMQSRDYLDRVDDTPAD